MQAITVQTYYSHTRKEVAPLIPKKVNRLLEIGCGSGATIAYLKQQNLCAWAAGVEIVPEAAEIAKQTVDIVWQENIETFAPPLDPQSLDVILCLDVLEHLVDPWAVVKKLTPLLSERGVIIASIPNIQHYTVLKGLIKGKFEYEEAGILDKTHLRFFTRQSAIALMTSSGLVLDAVHTKKRHWWKIGRYFPNFFAIQFLICVRKP